MGFQTYATSKGVTEEEIKEIEKHCSYIPPNNLNAQPSSEEIEKSFPIAFSYFVTTSGKYCICQTKYIGKDYSGRYGNYFSHVIINDRPWNFYPIQLYGSSIFKDRLEDGEDRVDFLPGIHEIPMGDVINFKSIEEFLKANIGERRSKSFKKLLDSLIDYKKSNKKIILCDEKDSVPYWIGALQICMPLKMAQKITFTTYSFNPETADYIVAATDRNGGKFNFNEIDKNYKYYIFDFINLKSSEQIYDGKFSKLAQVGLSVSQDSLLPFINFIDRFNYNMIDHNIDDLVYLYNMIKSGFGKMEVQKIKDGINFANEYASQENLEYIFDELEINLEKMSNEVDLEKAECISRFLFNIAKKSSNKDYMVKAYEFFNDSLHFLIVDREDIGIEDILLLHLKIKMLNYNKVEEFTKMTIDSERLKNIIKYLQGGNGRQAYFYLKTVLETIIDYNKYMGDAYSIKIGSSESHENDILSEFINTSFKILCDYPEELGEIFNIVYKYKETVEEKGGNVDRNNDTFDKLFNKSNDNKKNWFLDKIRRK